ncbi:MAG TPA: family 43 glycosylhydrolase [Candidatus Didemnitutus sp.]|nr:family 43 glycosylhydrolase [Candidatus Didemnitutus sp.]
MNSRFRIVAFVCLGLILFSRAAVARDGDGTPGWQRGFEGQRIADLGNGEYLNPVLPGDRPDPSVLKVGADYYLVNSSFESVPGLMIWHSRDLVSWEPVGPALQQYVGSVWAPDLSNHHGRFYIYFPALTGNRLTNMVVWADDIHGPWSAPIDLKLGDIDPGHAVGPDGKRYLFLSGGHLVPLADDGLSTAGPVTKIYEGWKYPDFWEVETFAQEGPKILHHGDYYYMVLAEGGTAGPATSHMVIMARSKTIAGPWENSPYNPVVHTASATEKWWSRGHATLVEGPDGKQWYLVYHAYENGNTNLGRQTLLEPVTWTDDGWVKASGYDVARPIPLPAGGSAVRPGLPFSDDFRTNKIGPQWTFFRPAGPIHDLYRYEKGALVLRATGTSPKDTCPLTFVTGDPAYEISVEIERDETATGGLLLFYSERLFAGFGFSEANMLEYLKGDTTPFPRPANIGRHFFLRLRNNHHVVTVWYSPEGTNWTKHWMQFEVSGYNHNVAGGFLSLRPALVATGAGEVRFRNFRYQTLP